MELSRMVRPISNLPLHIFACNINVTACNRPGEPARVVLVLWSHSGLLLRRTGVQPTQLMLAVC